MRQDQPTRYTQVSRIVPPLPIAPVYLCPLLITSHSRSKRRIISMRPPHIHIRCKQQRSLLSWLILQPITSRKSTSPILTLRLTPSIRHTILQYILPKATSLNIPTMIVKRNIPRHLQLLIDHIDHIQPHHLRRSNPLTPRRIIISIHNQTVLIIPIKAIDHTTRHISKTISRNILYQRTHP